jgi:hypothetical protein
MVLSESRMAGVKSLPNEPAESSRADDPAPMDKSALRSSHPALRNAEITIGPGWYGLVRELFGQLPREVIVARIKEADGELQVHLIGAADGCDEAIWRAAELSRYTCAVCGEPGEVVARNGWLKAVCRLHADAWSLDAPVPG